MLNVISLQKVRDLIALECFFREDNSSFIELTGNDVLDLLNRLSTNDIKKLKTNEGIGTVLTNNKGRIIDVLTLLNFENKTICLTSEGNATNVIQWIKKYIIMDDVRIMNRSEEYALFEVHGELSHELLNRFTDNEITITPLFHPQKCIMRGGLEVLVFRTDSVRDLAYKLIIEKKSASDLRNLIGSEIPKVSESEYDALKIMKGLPTFGRELTEDFNPLELGLVHLVNFKKGCYIGQEVIARLDSYNKVKQHLAGLTSKESIKQGDSIQIEGKDIGVITSTFSIPDSGITYSLGFVRTEFLQDGAKAQANSHDVSIHTLPMKLDE